MSRRVSQSFRKVTQSKNSYYKSSAKLCDSSASLCEKIKNLFSQPLGGRAKKLENGTTVSTCNLHNRENHR